MQPRSQSFTATRRPWRELLGHPLTSYSRPHTLTELRDRLKRNLNYFRVNYTAIMLLLLFFSLIWHPISMIVFVLVFSLWLYLYFLRDDQIVVFHRTIDDRLVLGLLSVVTIVSLVLTNVWVNVVVSVSIGIGFILLHSVFRVTEDLFVVMDEDNEDDDGGLVSFAGII